MPTNRKYIFWGASGHAKVLKDLLALHGCELIALFDNDSRIGSPWPQIPLFYGKAGFSQWLTSIDPSEVSAAVAIGGQGGAVRDEIANMLISAGFSLPAIMHPSAVVAASATIAAGCQILSNATIGADARIGANAIVNTASQVDHECVLQKGVHIAPGAILCGCVEIGEHTLIGPGAVVLPRIRIGKNAVIGAGSVVTRDIPDNVVAWGSPARPVKENIK